MNIDRIALIGYRATGKTSVGRMLADRLQWKFVDTDAEVEKSAGKNIAAIFADEGEDGFRQFERDAVGRHADQVHCVLSLGGGAVMQAANRRAIQGALTVWLTATPETIHSRLSRDEATAGQRPNLTSQGGLTEVRDLLTKRFPTYESCADLVVDTEGKSVRQVVDEISRALE